MSIRIYVCDYNKYPTKRMNRDVLPSSSVLFLFLSGQTQEEEEEEEEEEEAGVRPFNAIVRPTTFPSHADTLPIYPT
ncbi:hypothetical protein L249_8615 [Ophiocordyceps polyrhachis-furcata BCC 54312]|uniref:Uncharacterized protein n=1 Tax=Ophiocordyceps polyrhachis-furcata BCC 54312 TaxID=1330021 RepID=A0A367L6T3_9HYPO|nr:hypothetical protein L249_8615 [Ophiocordyceps polyrhachis-furcata BCC 54312]